MKKCPYCASNVEDAAMVCPRCTRDITKVAVVGGGLAGLGCFLVLGVFVLITLLVVLMAIFSR